MNKPKSSTIVAPPAPQVHKLVGALLRRRVRVLVIGCGGNGSEIVSGLPYLHQAMLAYGHPAGLEVLVMDGDVVSSTNIVRQAFAAGDVGHHKAPILVNRINAFWGLEWRSLSRHLEPLKKTPNSNGRPQGLGADILIGCVDSRAGRKIIQERLIADRGAYYWLDLGNDASSGQFVLGCPPGIAYSKRETLARNVPTSVPIPISVDRLPTVAELYPETTDASADKADTLPSCSAQEALQRQEPFVNRTLAAHALAMLARLFRYGELAHHGGFVNLQTGKVVPIPVSPDHWARTIAGNAVGTPSLSTPTRTRRRKSA